MVAVGIAVHYLLRYTRTGRYMYALGSNAEATRRQGIPVPTHHASSPTC